MSTIYLVSCVSQKRENSCEARDLYMSKWFQRARQFSEASGCPWFILSAEYGLVKPDEEIRPYERTLNNMRVADRRKWTDRVVEQLNALCDARVEVRRVSHAVFLAGMRYREFLVPHLRDRGVDVSVPMEGLRIGEQLSWLNHRLGR